LRSIIAPHIFHHFVNISREHRLYAFTPVFANCLHPQRRIEQKSIKPLVAHRSLDEAEQVPLDKIAT